MFLFLSLFRLPKDVNTRNEWCKWIANINNVEWTTLIGKCLFLCSKHFADDVKGKVKLKLGAIPTIHVSGDEEVLGDKEIIVNESSSNSPKDESTVAVEEVVDDNESSSNGPSDAGTRVVEGFKTSSNDFFEESKVVEDHGMSSNDPYADYSAVIEVDMQTPLIQVTVN